MRISAVPSPTEISSIPRSFTCGKAARNCRATRVFQAFDEDFGKVLNALNGMHEKLVQTKIHYEATEQEQEASVNKIAGLLNS